MAVIGSDQLAQGSEGTSAAGAIHEALVAGKDALLSSIFEWERCFVVIYKHKPSIRDREQYLLGMIEGSRMILKKRDAEASASVDHHPDQTSHTTGL